MRSRSAPGADAAQDSGAKVPLVKPEKFGDREEKEAMRLLKWIAPAVAGAARMAMRIDLQERAPDETEFHFVSASGLGVWRWADPKVKVYKYLKQVANLSSPASYRGVVRFRWLSAKGHVIKRAERVTARCLQPTPATPPEQTSPSSTSTTPTLGA